MWWSTYWRAFFLRWGGLCEKFSYDGIKYTAHFFVLYNYLLSSLIPLQWSYQLIINSCYEICHTHPYSYQVRLLYCSYVPIVVKTTGNTWPQKCVIKVLQVVSAHTSITAVRWSWVHLKEWWWTSLRTLIIVPVGTARASMSSNVCSTGSHTSKKTVCNTF